MYNFVVDLLCKILYPSLKILDYFQHPGAVPKVGNVNLSPSVGSFHMKVLLNKDAVDTHDVTSPMKAKGKEVANSNKKRENGEPCAKLLNAKKVLLKGSSVITNQEDDKDGGSDHIEDEQTLEPNNDEEEEEKQEEEGEEANVEIDAPSSKNWKFATFGKQTEHASGKFKAHKLASPSKKRAPSKKPINKKISIAKTIRVTQIQTQSNQKGKNKSLD